MGNWVGVSTPSASVAVNYDRPPCRWGKITVLLQGSWHSNISNVSQNIIILYLCIVIVKEERCSLAFNHVFNSQIG